MKKVLSVALASAMVLGMGANAFAISYSTGSNQEADWPDNFQFDGELFVTNKDGDLIEEASTALNDNESVDFEPGDVIWMPLYADDQVVYTSHYEAGTSDKDQVTSVQIDLDELENVEINEDWEVVEVNGNLYGMGAEPYNLRNGWVLVPTGNTKTYAADHDDIKAGVAYDTYVATQVEFDVPTTVHYDDADRTVKENSVKYYVGASKVSEDDFKVAVALNDNNAYATVTIEEEEGTDAVVGKPVDTKDTIDYGHYTGNIDKNWSINLIEKSTGVAELIEKAELYKATVTDVASYQRFGADITTNSVFLKVTLKDEWKTVDEETLTYYVYVADNDSGKQTNEVWVSGKYVNNNWEYVNFDWTNDASKAQLWKVKKGENGTAVFDFADKAFFTVKMYSGESMYLDLSTAYDKAIAGEMDAEADSFYKFDNENANFSRTGELIIVTDDSSLVPYEIDEDGNFVEVDAKYVENYAIAHTNKKVDGFVFSTKTLGNYVLSTEELGQEEQPAKETPAEPVTPSEPTTETPSTSKPNPDTGAEDFVGLAVSLAVVSVAAAGALALKK